MALAVARDKTGKVYKIRELLQNKFEQEKEAEQSLMNVAHDLEAEEVDVSDILMPCEEDDDPLVGVPGEATMANIMKVLNSVTAQVGQLTDAMGKFQRGTDDISIRMLRVEKKLGITMATVEQIKNVIAVSDVQSAGDANAAAAPSFSFDPIDDEERLNDLDYKLGTDEEFYNKLSRWLNQQIVSEEANGRLHEAMELLFTRQFMSKCSWRGKGKPEPKIPMSAQTHVIKLLITLGSNRYIAITDAFVAKFFLKKFSAAQSSAKSNKKPKSHR